ncbi:MAG: BglG family transcription antiterminator [Clostridium sp.]
MKSREIKILEELLSRKESIWVEELSNLFKVSKRMIRYDIDNINYYLRKNEVPEIEKKANSPINITEKKLEREKIKALISGFKNEVEVLSIKERIGIILYELLSIEKGITYKRIQDIGKISRITAISDLKEAEKWIERYNLRVEKIRGKIFIQGSEKNKRDALRALLIGENEYNILKIIEKIYNKENNNFINTVNRINISSTDIESLKSEIKSYENEIGELNDDSMMNIVISIVIIINRKELIGEKEYLQVQQDYKKEYLLAKKLLEKLQMRFEVEVTNKNINYLASRLVSTSKTDEEVINLKDRFVVVQIADKLIEEYRNRYEKQFFMEKGLYTSFLNHINGLIFRLKYNIKSENILLVQILENYKEIFNGIKGIYKENLEDEIGKISDDELGYIALYFRAAIEKFKERVKKRKKRILIVCSCGLATSRLLEAKIKKRYDVEIVGIASIHSIDKYTRESKVDFIISNMKIDREKSSEHIEMIQINNIFNDDELKVLDEYLDYKVQNKKDLKSDMEEIIKLIEKTCDVRERNALQKGLEKIFNINESKLKKYIKRNYINLNIEVQSWKEAIEKSAKPLLKDGIITEKYIESMIENVEKYGAYIVVDEGIAIPHAKAENNVLEDGITITTIKKGIDIIDEKDVRLLITIGIKDKKNHIAIITEIMKLIENESIIKKILKAESIEEVYEYI